MATGAVGRSERRKKRWVRLRGCGLPASGTRWMAAADAWTTCSSSGCDGRLKYEAVYLHELADGRAARRVIGQWMAFYNEQRPHSALGGRTPAQCYDGERAAGEQAA